MSHIGYKNVGDDWGEGWRSPDRQSSLFANRPRLKETACQVKNTPFFRQLVAIFLRGILKVDTIPGVHPDVRSATNPAHRTVRLPVPAQVAATNHIKTSGTSRPLLSGVAGWALRLWHRSVGLPTRPPKLMLIEKITIGHRQSLSLIEAEGVRVLIATGAEGTPALFALASSGGAGALDDPRRTVPLRSTHRCLAIERRRSNHMDGRSVGTSRVSW